MAGLGLRAIPSGAQTMSSTVRSRARSRSVALARSRWVATRLRPPSPLTRAITSRAPSMTGAGRWRQRSLSPA